MYRTRLISALLAATALAGPALAQHEYPQVDIERGRQLYTSNCIGCHGPDGNLVEDISLTDPVFLQAMTDTALITFILNGIPGTAMPANDYTQPEAGNIVAYLRDMAAEGRTAPVNGNPDRGKALYVSHDCMNCHRIGASGSRLGPDLSRIGLQRRTRELEESLLDPGATVLPENRYVHVVTGNGQSITGRLMNHDKVTVELLDSSEHLRLFNKAGLSQFELLESSTMPSYATDLSRQQVEDLLSYLVSLKGGEKQ